MKSIFKKLAFVLALAMIVTLIPAKSAKAADATFSVSKSSIIYVGGSYAGYPASKYVKSWGYDKDTYTASYASSNADVATVSAKGLVTAVSVGTAVITVTLQTEDGTIYATNSTKVFVKKNAVSVELGAGTQTHITTGVDAGESFYLAVKRTAADGTTTWKGKTVITDYVKYESSDEKVFTVDKFGKLTGVDAGTATLTMTTMELDGTKDTTKAVATTTPVTYTVKVTAGSIVEAKQTASKVVKLTISSAAAAAKLVATGTSAFKAWYVAGTNDIDTPIKSVAADADNAAIVDVTLYNNITAAATYKFAIAATADTKVSIVGADNTIASLKGNTNTGYVLGDVAVSYSFLNADGVDITDAVKADAGAYITLSLAKESADWYLTSSSYDGAVHFYKAGSVDVNVTYDKYTTDGKETKFTAVSTVTALATAATYGTATYTLVKEDTKSTSDSAYGLTWQTLYTSVVAGETNYLYASIASTYNSAAFTSYPDTADNIHTSVTYSSSDSSVLAVGNAEGTQNAKVVGVKAGTASIIVTYTLDGVNTVVAVLPVTVYASRVLTTFTAACDNSKVSAPASGTATSAITITAKDQLGQAIAYTDDQLSAAALSYSNVTKPTDADLTEDASAKKVYVTANGITDTSVGSVTVKYTLTYNGVTMTAIVVPTFKKPTATVSYALNVAGANQSWSGAFDTNLYNSSDATIAALAAKFSVNELDKDGFVVTTKTLADEATTDAAVTVKINGTTVASSAGSDSLAMFTMSGSAVTKKNVAVGKYTAALYFGTKYKAAANVTVVDDTASATVKRDASVSKSADIAQAIKDCFTVTTSYKNGSNNCSVFADYSAVDGSIVVKDIYIVQKNGWNWGTYTYNVYTTVGLTINYAGTSKTAGTVEITE